VGDRYLRSVLEKYHTRIALGSAAAQAITCVSGLIQTWADRYLIRITLVGSHAKGTAVRGANDIDLFVSMRHVPRTDLGDVYNHLNKFLTNNGLTPERRRVALKVKCGGIDIDVVPGRKLIDSSDHMLYHSKRDSWIKTNVFRHVRLVANSRRTEEIRAIKIWRELNGLDFPSLYLELSVLRALRQRSFGRVSMNVWAVLQYLETSFARNRIVDPANTNNVISEDLTLAEKNLVVAAAHQSLQARIWERIIW
jgi:Nucleotidyltransferase domain.